MTRETRRSLIAYLGAVAACAVIVVFAYELWRADLRVPLDDTGDSILTQLLTKTVVETGWFLSNPSLGAPLRMELHDFPLVDSLFFLGLKVLSWATTNYVLVLNIDFLLTFPLTALTALFVLRRFEVPRVPAAVCGLLYAFLPYHFLRGEAHLLLASYFLVPLAAWVCLRLYRDGELLFREVEGSRRARPAIGSRRAVAALAVCLLMGSGGVYYAFFTCYLLLVAGACAAVARRRLHPLGSAGILIAVIALGVAANVASKLRYDLRHGPNPVAVRRDPGETELYGLKIVRLLLPVADHRLGAFRQVRERYDRTQSGRPDEGGSSALGLVGAAGFLGLLGVLVLGRRLGAAPAPTWDGLATLNVAALLLATTGGLGTVFGFLVTPMLRGTNRIVVFLGFFALTAVALVLARAVRAARPGGPRLAVNLAIAGLLVVGVLDQASPRFVPDHARLQARFADDAEFVGRIEATLPPGSMVFQLPAMEFPEGFPPVKLGFYDLARPYLHSRAIRWSFGAMKGRAGGDWQNSAFDQPAPAMLRRVALTGFSGIYVDRDGYADGGAALCARLAELAGAAPIESRDGRLAFYDLRPFAAALRRDLGPARWAAEREVAVRPVIPTWLGGFHAREYAPDDYSWHWSDGSGEVLLSNPLPRPRRVELSMGLATCDPGPATVRVEGPDGLAEYPVDAVGREIRRTIVVPPGGATLRFASDAKKVVLPGFSRVLAFRVDRLRVSESVEGPAVAAVGAAEVRR